MFIMKQGIFLLWLRHHTSAHNVYGDAHPFFTLHLQKSNSYALKQGSAYWSVSGPSVLKSYKFKK